MKKVIVFVLLTFTFVFITPQEINNFRKTNWGMTLQQIKKIEKTKLLKEEKESLIYKDEILGFPVGVAFLFDKFNKLYLGKYVFFQKHSNKTDFIYDFIKIEKTLEKKYKIPNYNKKIWKNDLYEDEHKNWGTAVSIGHLVLEAKWILINTEILLQLSGDNFDIKLIIQYSDRNYKKEDNLDKL